MGSFASLSALPFVPAKHMWFVLAIALFACTTTIAFEERCDRKRVVLICIGGLIFSSAVAWLVSTFFVQLVLWIFSMLVAAVGLYGTTSTEKDS